MGDGGEGLVFRATANFGEQEHDVALKMHTSLTLDDFERFSRRARALSEIDHPNVMHMIEVFIGTALVDCDDSPDEAFNVMYTVADWVPGLSLPGALEATSAASGLHWVSEVARATCYLHDFRSTDAPEGLIHRDIKPSNVRVTTDERAVLIDFGIARPHQKGDLTEGAGTYLWRAPEVVGGPGDPGPASDVWGIGALAYWVLLGEPPRLEGADTARKLLEPAASQAGFVDPPGLSGCISELLETHPKDRPTDLARWADELELSVAGKRRRRVKSRRIAFVAVAAMALAAAAAVVATGPSGLAATKSAVFAFKPQSFPSGLIVDRTWTLSGATGDHLEGSATLENGKAVEILASYYEVLPKSVASNVNRVKFSPPPHKILQSDPVVLYPVFLPAGMSEKIAFSVNIGPTDGDRATRLRQLARAQDAAEASYLASNHLAVPATLKTMQITPSTLTLTAGQSKRTTLTGTMSNGAASNQRELSGVAWNSSAPTVATAADGIVSGLTTGTATVTAQAGSVKAIVSVTVDALSPASSGPNGSVLGGANGGVKNPGTGSPASGATTTTPKGSGSGSGGSPSGGSPSGGSTSGGSTSGGSTSGGSTSGGSPSGGSTSGSGGVPETKPAIQGMELNFIALMLHPSQYSPEPHLQTIISMTDGLGDNSADGDAGIDNMSPTLDCYLSISGVVSNEPVGCNDIAHPTADDNSCSAVCPVLPSFGVSYTVTLTVVNAVGSASSTEVLPASSTSDFEFALTPDASFTQYASPDPSSTSSSGSSWSYCDDSTDACTPTSDFDVGLSCWTTGPSFGQPATQGILWVQLASNSMYVPSTILTDPQDDIAYLPQC